MITTSTPETSVKTYESNQNACVKLIQIISDLWFNQSIELVLFRNQLIDRRVSFILNLHQETKEYTGVELNIMETLKVAEAIYALDLNPSRLDIGKLALNIRKQRIQEATEIGRASCRELE